MMVLPRVSEVREHFRQELSSGHFVTDKSGVKTIELIGASFVADEPSIFGKVDHDYIDRELEWYDSKSLNVNDIRGGPPKIWKQVATPEGFINSNYGWSIYSAALGVVQYDECLKQLQFYRNTRRAVMIYTRPTMQWEYAKEGMSDFICTNVVQFFIRDGRMHCLVQMRSNDVVFGYRNDRAWHARVLGRLCRDYNELPGVDVIIPGDIIWNAGSLHVYERHFPLLNT